MKKILVVDDAEFIRKTLKMMLERNNFEVVDEASDGQFAVQNLRH